jgi:hypothetical protein
VRGVSFSPGLKWLILPLLLLPLTLAWKLVASPAERRAPNDRDIQARVGEFLNRQHFVVSAAERVSEGNPMLAASAGPCRMLITRAAPIASDRDMIRQNASAGDSVFIVFHGQVYSEQPTWLTAADFLWSRFRRELGFSSPSMGPIAVIATRNCDAERLPWAELR